MPSTILLKPAGVKVSNEDFNQIFEKRWYEEMGACSCEEGVIIRKVDFKTQISVLEFLNNKEDTHVLVNFDNPNHKYNNTQYSPFVYESKIAIAGCGEPVTINKSKEYKGRSPTNVFIEDILFCDVDSTELLKIPAYQWTLRRMLLPYSSILFLYGNGDTVMINKHNFRNLNGLIYSDFTKARKASQDKEEENQKKFFKKKNENNFIGMGL